MQASERASRWALAAWSVEGWAGMGAHRDGERGEKDAGCYTVSRDAGLEVWEERIVFAS